MIECDVWHLCTVTRKSDGEVFRLMSVLADNPGNAEIVCAMHSEIEGKDLGKYIIDVVEVNGIEDQDAQK